MLGNLGKRILLRQFKAPRVPHSLTPESLGLQALSAKIPAQDGGQLFGWWIKAEPVSETMPKPTVIVLHGWGANASLMLDMAPWIQRIGFHSLFIDARCHGESSDAEFTSMPRFAEDLESAKAWVQQQPEVDPMRLVAIGHSVGAGAVLLSASRSTWSRVVSLSAFAHPVDMMQRFMREHHIPRWFVEPWIMRQVQEVIGARFYDIAPEHTIRKVSCPIILIHGAVDRDVPLSEAKRVFQSAPPGTQSLIVPNCGHDLRAATSFVAPRVADFLREISE